MIQKFIATTLGKVAIAVIGLLAFYALVQNLSWDKAAQPKQDVRSANAAAETAKEAAEIAIDRSEADASVDRLVERTAKLIDTLPPEQAAIEARKAICSFAEHKDDPSCAK